MGIGIEKIGAIKYFARLCKAILSPSEVKGVFLPPSEQEKLEKCYFYWTLKEPYLKVTRAGRGASLSSHSFRKTKDDIILLRNNREGFHFTSFKVTNQHYSEITFQES